MAKYIFLDFDGVLNTENYQKQLKQSGSIATDRYGFLFDPAAVANLKTIIDKTGGQNMHHLQLGHRDWSQPAP